MTHSPRPARFRTLARPALAWLLLALPAPAGISPDNPVVDSEGHCTLAAAPEAPDWKLDPGAPGSLQVQAGGASAVYSAPLALETLTVAVRATDRSGAVHTARITVAPHPAWRTMGEVWGKDWREPRLEIVAGKAEPGGTVAFPSRVHAIAFADDPALDDLHRCWIVGDATGTHVLPAAGPARPLGEGFGLRTPIQSPGIALRPPGDQANPLHLVFSDCREFAVRAWDPKGGARILAGRPPAECAALRRPACISINADGACLVGMESCIVQLELADLDQSASVDRSPGSSPMATAFR